MEKPVPIIRSKFIKPNRNSFAAFAAALVIACLCARCTNATDSAEMNQAADSLRQTKRSARFFIEDCKILITEARRADSVVLVETDYNEATAMQAIKAFTAYAIFCHDDSLSPVYLIKAAQVARAGDKKHIAKQALENCLENYPSSSEKPAALFLLARLYDEPGSMQNISQADKLYRDIINDYPSSVWADNARGALTLLGKSDDEILMELKKKNKR